MAAAFKSRLQSDLSEPGASQGQSLRTHYCSGYPCIKTNGSLVRSLSVEEREMSALNGGSKLDQGIDEPSPPLKDVEALLKEYSHSHFKKGENGHREDENDEDDDFAENGSSPILLSECPEFQECLQLLQAPNTDDVNEDEIIFGFKSPRKGDTSKDKKEDEDALWEFIEAEAEGLCLAEEGSRRCQGNGAAKSPAENSVKAALTSGCGVAALLDCAATEMCRLRDGAAIMRKYPPQDISGSPEASPTLKIQPVSPMVSVEERQEKATSTTGTLTSLLQIQLAQINRMSETVRIEFSNQLAHERALLELLELEHNRVKTEVKVNEKEKGFAPTDLLSQFRHLKERLDQQKTLIDDLEYQYLEDKTKYEEEKESLMAQLKLQEEIPSDTSTEHDRLEIGKTKWHRERSPEDGYTYPSSIFTSRIDGPLPGTSSPIYSSPPVDSPINFNCPMTDPVDDDNCHKRFLSGYDVTTNVKSEVQAFREEQPHFTPVSAAQAVNVTNADFGQFSPLIMPGDSPVRHQWNMPEQREHKTSLQLNTAPVFHQQNGHSMDETYYIPGNGLLESPQTSLSLPGGLNPHATTTSSSSSLLPTGRDLQQSPCTTSSNNVFHAVPPLLPSLSANADHLQWKREDPISIRCSNEVQIRYRQRTSSVATRRYWQDNEARPLTRYLPVPDDILFDLRHHLEITCGHILCSPLLMPHLHVDATMCAGYLFKVDSRVTSTPGNDNGDASKNSTGDKSSSSISNELATSAFFSPATRRARKRSSRVTSPSGAGGFMSALFHRSRRGKRRWFVLDRRRRLLIYYSCHTSKSSNAASLLKPKDVISFTDIIDVYPDRQGRKGNNSQNSSFCLLLVASCPPPPSMVSPQCRPLPTRTRILSLTAPSPEAMRVWVDALFTCAGAYLCLLNATPSTQRRDEQSDSADASLKNEGSTHPISKANRHETHLGATDTDTAVEDNKEHRSQTPARENLSEHTSHIHYGTGLSAQPPQAQAYDIDCKLGFRVQTPTSPTTAYGENAARKQIIYTFDPRRAASLRSCEKLKTDIAISTSGSIG
ncbi:hypothetical protein Aperf_G00000078629 [Anoplocephala perfoliata]